MILSRVGVAALKHNVTPEPAHLFELAARHEVARSARISPSPGRCPPAVSASIAHWRDPPAAELARTEVMEVALARQISDELRTPGVGGELPDSMLGPVSKWMDELSIYPEELFSIMAQRAAICATAESYT